MVYFDHQMASSISDKGGSSKKAGSSMSASYSTSSKAKSQRNQPSKSMSSKSKSSYADADEKVVSKYKIDVDLKKLMFMRNLLKAEVCL